MPDLWDTNPRNAFSTPDEQPDLAPDDDHTKEMMLKDQLIGGLLDPQPLGQRRQRSPAPARARAPSKAMSTWSSTTCVDVIGKASSGSGIVTAWQPSFSLVRGPFS
jgi:hypothetical protein